MGLLDIKNNPDYLNANEATKQAIFDEYSKDDPDYVNANSATKDAIRREFGLGSTTTTTPELLRAEPPIADVAMAQAPMVARGVVQPYLQSAASENVKDIATIAKNASAWTPNSLMEVISHPVQTAKAYVYGHPWADKPIKQIASNVGRGITGALVQGAVSPESLFAAPYSMAAYEQEKIRANPNAPEYATNPYAQMYRGEAPTQGAAGAMNRRAAIAGQQYGGLTQEEQDILEQDRIDREIRRKAAQKVLGPIAP